MEFLPVERFRYNGFCGEGMAPEDAGYTAKFVRWTIDPGIGIFICSDGKYRLIPTYAVKGFKHTDAEPQAETGLLFGGPCKWDDPGFSEEEIAKWL